MKSLKLEREVLLRICSLVSQHDTRYSCIFKQTDEYKVLVVPFCSPPSLSLKWRNSPGKSILIRHADAHGCFGVYH